jgi:thymidylate synthase ThyX
MARETPQQAQESLQLINDWLELGSNFVNPPTVSLQLRTQPIDPSKSEVGLFDIAVTTAVQCYSPGRAIMKVRDDEKSRQIGDSTLDGGHLTTRQHGQMTWHIAASRSVIQEIFHSYPYYNSDQQSQRYVEAKQGNFLMPANLAPEQQQAFLEAANFMNEQYFILLEQLEPYIRQRVVSVNPKKWNQEKNATALSQKVQKLCQEIARYVLPINQFTELKHSLSHLQLLRLFHAARMENFPDEARFIIASMMKSVLDIDSSFANDLRMPLAEISMQDRIAQVVSQTEGADTQIEHANRTPDLRDYLGNKQTRMLNQVSSDETTGLTNIETTLVMAVRNAAGPESDHLNDLQILDLLIDPAANKYLADTYMAGMHDPITASLRQVGFSFVTELSLTAEAQRQRQRTTPASVPPMVNLLAGPAEFIAPMIVRQTPELLEIYEAIMGQVYANIQAVLALGTPPEIAALLLPNSHKVRIVESGNLFDFLHRLKQRLCYLAQEEFCFISIEQASQMIDAVPRLAKLLMAPCGIRHRAAQNPNNTDVTPYCPEGSKFCGVAVWNKTLEQYAAGRLI